MPSSFSHAIGGMAIGSPLFSGPVRRRYWIVAALCAAAPDLDYLWKWAVPAGHWLAHRGLTHAPIFAIVLAAVMTRAAFGRSAFAGSRLAIWGGLTLATASHGLLDAMSTYGPGVPFLLPFSTRRFFLPWRPISAGLGPHDHGLLGGLLETIGSELVWIWIPAVLLLWVTARLRKRRARV